MLRRNFLIFILLFIGSFAANAQLKIGFVSSDIIIQQLPEAQVAQKQLDALQKETLDTLKSLETEMQTKMTEYQQKGDLLTEDAKKRAQKEFTDLQNKYQDLRQRKSEELQKKQSELLSPILEKVQETIDKIAEEEGLSFIFDKSQRLPLLLYGDPKFDYTNKVVDVMKRGGSKTTKKKTK